MPGKRAVEFHFVDHVVHAWDVAVALGLPLRLPEPVLRAALPIALAAPDGPGRRAPDSAFRPSLPPQNTTGPEAGTLPLVLAALGRSAHWRPPEAR
ncbi:hypothetical protein ACH4MM_02855 [Streptomyces pratensis]|uniref:hypothetical protein n=1 Tax=Streptomyces pratensis TaxID=1169025 RepID=UPI00378FE600